MLTRAYQGRRPRFARLSRRSSLVMLGLASLMSTDACFTLDDPTAVSGADVMRLDVARAGDVLATGAARVPVTVTLLGDTPTGTEVTLRTDDGSWVGASTSNPKELKLKSPSRVVQATMIAGIDPGVATISAEAGGFVVSDTITLRPAPPDTLELTSDVSRVPANGQSVATLTARLLRAVGSGVPSRGTRVHFDVSLAGVLVPDLSSTVDSDSTGYARRTLATRTPGSYRIVARAGTVADTLTLEFVAP